MQPANRTTTLAAYIFSDIHERALAAYIFSGIHERALASILDPIGDFVCTGLHGIVDEQLSVEADTHTLGQVERRCRVGSFVPRIN